ncbi:hypothetical protein ACHQM5_019594 [Ranunculus cassubicifolius]
MATPSHSQAVKSLNTSGGRKRFSYKSFSQRIEDINLGETVFRSLDPQKAQPSDDSSFFRDCLIEWRELNTAEDFISFYEEMMPLPQIILEQKKIMKKLLDRLRVTARLSLEPILRLIAALSRDLLKDFLPFLNEITIALVKLLQDGAEREPEVVEQIFSSWSYIMMYLKKYLIVDIVELLEVTRSLRYYPKDYVQEFMAESVSFLFRNLPHKHENQLTEGIKEIMREVEESSDVRTSGASALLGYIMKGVSSRFHSRAERVLRLLMSSHILNMRGSLIIVEVVTATFQRLCEEFDSKELKLLWDCLFDEISNSIGSGNLLRLKHLMSLVISCIQFCNRGKISDYEPMLDIVNLLIQTYFKLVNETDEGQVNEIVEKVLQLMLCLLDGILRSSDSSSINRVSSQWAPVFEQKNDNLLSFIKELVQKDSCVSIAFRSHILSAIDHFVDVSPREEVIYLMLTFFEKHQSPYACINELCEEKFPKMCSFLQKSIHVAINNIAPGDLSSKDYSETELAVLWGVLCCYSYLSSPDASLMMDLVNVLDQLPIIEVDNFAGVPKCTWQSLIGAALTSYHKLQQRKNSTLAEKTQLFLDLAKKYRSSSHILFAVAEYLDSVPRSLSGSDATHSTIRPELEAEKAIDAINVFADNMSLPEDVIRMSTLRILGHYEPLGRHVSESDQPARKKLKTGVCQPYNMDAQCNNAVQILLSIEVTPLSPATSTQVTLLISQIQMGLTAGRFSEDYVPLLLNGIIGIFHKRLSTLWDSAKECLTVLIDKHPGIVWDRFISYLEQCQVQFLTSGNQLERINTESSNTPNDLEDCFKAFLNPATDSTPCRTVLCSLLQSLQRVQSIAESKSRKIVPLFLSFLGYNDDSVRDCTVGSFSSHLCKGKEWRVVLKEWLDLLKVMRNARSLYRSQILKEVLIKRLLDETDADIQLKVLDCLLNWKDDFLLPYDQHLKNLITSKNLREELATWTLSQESHHIEDIHRGFLIPIVIRLLIPKVRNLKTLASRKNASLNHRRAILCFLAQMEIKELLLFFVLLIKPLQSASSGNEGLSKWFWSSSEISLEEFQACNIEKYFTGDKIMEISSKKRFGFLYVVEDILKSFDEFHLKPFLNLLVGLVVRIMESCTLSLDGSKSNGSSHASYLSNENQSIQKSDTANPMTPTAIKQLKDQRSLCLKIISLVLNKYDGHDFDSFWDIFFSSIKPLIEGFKQEGASSERPSSLFSCFLAMSRSDALVSLLLREECLVSTIFSVLTVKTASDAVTASVLSFIENLLNLDSNLDGHQEVSIKSVLLPNLGPLIDSMHSFFQRHCDSQRKGPGKTELRIFKLLSNYINEPLAVKKFVEILLPFLSRKSQNPDEYFEVIQVIRGIVPKLGTTEISAKILNAVSPLLITAGRDVRLSICDLLEGLAINDPSVASLAELLRQLNAMSVSEIDELDYDSRVNAYESVDQNFFYALREDHALVILSHSVYDMSSEELTLRLNAYGLFLSFIKFSVLILDAEDKNKEEVPGEVVAMAYDSCWTKACIHRIVKKFFLKHLGEAMNKGISIQREWISLLREMVLRLPQLPALNSVKELCSHDAEVNFFNNILHLQIHRRVKALARFRKAIGAGDFSETITKNVFVPLFFKMMFDVQDGGKEHFRNACLEALASVSGHLQWESYHGFLLRCFREMSLRPDKQKVLLRLICRVLDHFHFNNSSTIQETEIEMTDIGANRVDSLSVPGRNSTGEIQTRLQKTVLPKIHKLLNEDSEKVSVTINLAALKLLKLLPVDTMESQLPSILHRVCNFLKNRMDSVRDEARHALAAVSKELGLEYLLFIVKILRSTLKRGYEMHVLGYTLNFILSKALLTPSTGKLDYCLGELLSVAENDILGDVAEEKEVEKIASKMKETKKPKSFGTLKLIAQNVTFKTHALKLLSPVKAHLDKHLTPKLKAKLENMLNHIAEGIQINPSVQNTDLFVFVYGLIEDGILEENQQGKELSIAKSTKHLSNGGNDKRKSSPWIAGYKSQSSHLITVFSLRLLHNRLKSMKFDKKDEQMLSMLDPFVKLLADCLTSKFEDILSAALRCLGSLIRLPLPSLANHADNIKTLLLDIAQKSGNSSSPLLESCLTLLTVLLRSSKVTLSSEQLHMLIQFPLFIDLEKSPSFIALSLLKSIVRRKLVVPQVFDIVTRVAELMVTSQDEPIRKKCSQILLRFMVDYPLAKKRLQQHLDFLLSNLSYEHSTGREAVLEMLHAVIVKFPKQTVDEHSRAFFIPLVVCLANEQDSKVRPMVGAALKLLIGRISQSSLSSILEYILSWYIGEKKNLWSAAAQVLGLLVEVLKKGFRRHINNLVPVMKSILNSTLSNVESWQPKDANEATIPLWRECYYSLVLLEKLLLQFPELYFEKDIEEIWSSICGFLLFPHMWIRNISSRLVTSYFTSVSENSEKLKQGAFLLMRPGRLFAIAVYHCCQLKAQLTDDSAANTVITQNLVFSICGVHSLLSAVGLQEFWAGLEMHEQGLFVKAFHLLGSKKGVVTLATLSGERDLISEDLQSLIVSPLIKRLGKVALQMEHTQMKIVFNCFKTISSQIGQLYAADLLLPLYKVCEGFAGKVIADDVKQLAEEVRDSIRENIGLENFVKVYNEIRKNLKAKRDKRKNQEKLMAVVNPMRNAKRKLRLAEKHRAHKKRKIMTLKKGRWSSGR